MANVLDIDQIRQEFEKLREQFLATEEEDEEKLEGILDQIYDLDEQVGDFIDKCTALHDEMDAFYEEHLEEVGEEEGEEEEEEEEQPASGRKGGQPS